MLFYTNKIQIKLISFLIYTNLTQDPTSRIDIPWRKCRDPWISIDVHQTKFRDRSITEIIDDRRSFTGILIADSTTIRLIGEVMSIIKVIMNIQERDGKIQPAMVIDIHLDDPLTENHRGRGIRIDESIMDPLTT